MTSIGELFIELAFESDTEGAKKFKKKVQEVIKTIDEKTKTTDEETKAAKKNAQEKAKQGINIANCIKAARGYIVAITGAIYALQRLTDSLISQNQEWLNLTRTSDVALSTYQKWNGIGKVLGVDNAASQIKNLNDRLFELKLTGANAKGFMLAGINPTNPEDVMEQLRNRVKGLSDTSASYLLRQLGLDENMLHILRLSREEFEGINGELKQFQLSEQQRRSIQEMNFQIQIASQKLQYLKDRAVLAIMPAWTKFLQSLARVTQGVVKIIEGFRALSSGIKFLASAITLTLIPALTALMGHPVIATITALLSALYLIIDDIIVFFRGGDSITGLILEFLDRLQEKLDKIKMPEWVKTLLNIPATIPNSSKDSASNVAAVASKDPIAMTGFALQNLLPGFSMIRGFDLMKSVRIPSSNSYINNNKTQNPTINQYNNIQTQQPAQTIFDNLTLLQRKTAYQTL